MFTARFCGTDQPTGRAQAQCRWEPHVCAPLGCQRSRGSMKRCQEMQSNEGMYSRRATQRESDWLVQGLCLAPFLCRRDWRHHAGSCLAKRKRKRKKVKATQGKVVLLHLIKIQARPRCVSRRTIDSSLLIKRNDKLQKLADSVKFWCCFKYRLNAESNNRSNNNDNYKQEALRDCFSYYLLAPMQLTIWAVFTFNRIVLYFVYINFDFLVLFKLCQVCSAVKTSEKCFCCLPILIYLTRFRA